MAEVCYYADEEYSEGSIIKVEGDLYECGDLGEGILTWIEYFGGKEVQAASGSVSVAKAVVCYYGGKKYSVGAPLKMGDGKIRRCSKDGKWLPIPK